MINLLPPQVKEDLVYARRNTKLIRWALAMFIAMAGVFLIAIIGQLYIDQSAQSYTAQNKQLEEQLKVQKLEETQKRVEGISSSVKLVVQVLSRQVLFSALLRQIGSAIPQNAVLTGLSINKLQGGIELTAAATDYQTATQVQVNLQDPNNKIFEKADILNIQCASAVGGSSNSTAPGSSQLDSKYPCKITIKALFSKNNPFLFINTQKAQP